MLDSYKNTPYEIKAFVAINNKSTVCIIAKYKMDVYINAKGNVKK